LRARVPHLPSVQVTCGILFWPRAGKRVLRAMRVWIWAAWRLGSWEAIGLPKDVRRRKGASLRLRACGPVSRFQSARPKWRVARKVSFLAWAAGPSSFQGRPLLRIGSKEDQDPVRWVLLHNLVAAGRVGALGGYLGWHEQAISRPLPHHELA